ncbi:protein max [Microplitis demolitor]|uniref:protein max n=1 Tax=Microplitis demolitor TaxID=69319 RepID=UPI0004CD323C|nr:protein max [Microplitis demolitor]
MSSKNLHSEEYFDNNESDDCEQYDNDDQEDIKNTQLMTAEEKRAHHNALERKRRDGIKENFLELKETVNALMPGNKATSRTQILRKSAAFIRMMENKNARHEQDILILKRQNELLHQQILAIENTLTRREAGVDVGDSSIPDHEIKIENSSGSESSESSGSSESSESSESEQ